MRRDWKRCQRVAPYNLSRPLQAALLARAINETSKGGRDWADILGNAGGKPVAQMLKDAVRNDTAVMQLERSLSNSGASAQQIDGIMGSIETLAFAHRFYNQDGSAAQSGSPLQARCRRNSCGRTACRCYPARGSSRRNSR